MKTDIRIKKTGSNKWTIDVSDDCDVEKIVAKVKKDIRSMN